MKTEETPQQDYHQPVAYDAQGRPLYAHPPVNPVVEKESKPQVVHIAKMVEPVKQEVSPEVQAKHERSKRMFPMLNLSEGEFVIRAVRRHPIGLFFPLAFGSIVIAFALSVLFNYAAIVDALDLEGALANFDVVSIPIIVFCGLIGIGMYISYYVYTNNKFFLTNESVIQEIQVSLFSKNEQTVSLANIEDASFLQNGIISHIFNYGAIRLSTQGDETTYRFTFVANPKQHIATLNNAVEAFKHGRPVTED